MLPLLIASILLAAEPDKADVRLTPKSVLHFATVEEGQEVIGRTEPFIQALGSFDLSGRMKTQREVSQEEYLSFAKDQVLAWSDEEKSKLGEQWKRIAERLEPFELPLPERVLLIKTTGREEGNAAYTRGAAIVLPQSKVRGGSIERLLEHELFHVMSRHSPELRKQLYAIVGFHPCGEVQLTDDIRARMLHNPDAWQHGYCITLGKGNDARRAIPLLISETGKYDEKKGGEFFRYIEFKLLVIDDSRPPIPVLEDGKPVLIDPDDAPDYHAQIGENTKYIIHAEEVLADNFVLLLSGATDVKTPRILDEMRKVLSPAPR